MINYKLTIINYKLNNINSVNSLTDNAMILYAKDYNRKLAQ